MEQIEKLTKISELPEWLQKLWEISPMLARQAEADYMNLKKQLTIPDVVGQSEQLKCGVLGGFCPYETGDRLCRAEFNCENQVAF